MRLPETPKPVPNTVNITNFGAHVLNIAVTLTIAYFAFTNNKTANDVSLLDAAFSRIKAQDETIARQDQTIVRLTAQLQATNSRVLELDALVRTNMSVGNAAIQESINTMPVPYWIKKRLPNDDFIMFMINDAYTSQFNVTRNQYIGFTDYHIHPKKLADEYRANDLLVSDTKKTVRSREYVSVNGEFVPIQVFKFPVSIASCQVCVGGMAITYED